MARARLAYPALAISLVLISGCASTHQNECHSSGGWFSRFRQASRTTTPQGGAQPMGAPCDCEGSGMAPHGDMGPVMMPPGTGLPPGAFVAPQPAIITMPPAGSQPPRIVPVPQANPTPYAP
jgi:hypothetical protein